MTERENVLEIIRFGKPAKVMAGIPMHAVDYFGCHHDGFDGGGHHLPMGSKWSDIWGTVWHREHEGVMGFPRGNPLANLVDDMKTYSWPDPDDERLCHVIDEKAGTWDKETMFLSGANRDTLWERTYMLCGMEEAMCLFHTEPNAMRELLHHIMDFQLGMARHYVKAGVEFANLGDDLGTQNALLLSPEIIAGFLVPEYRRLFQFYQAHGVLINFHSCGHILPIIDIFADLGVDVLNPIQTTANDVDELRRVTQGRMALMGGVNSAVIASGPIDAIRRETRTRLWQLGRNGGYFCRQDQRMPWPVEHYQAYQQTLEQFGNYPLQPPGNG